MKHLFVAIGLAGLLLVGCFHAPGGIAPSTIPLEPNGYTVIKEDVKGTDCVWKLLEILPISGGNHLDNAVKEAIKRSKADALVGVTVETTSTHLLIIGRDCTQVRGQAVRVTSGGTGTSTESPPTPSTP